MYVLIACERSGIVRDAFLAAGHRAVSCDIVPSDRPGPHFRGDVRHILGLGWDLMVAFPPCTHLAASGRRWFREKQPEQREAIDFFLSLWHAEIPRVAVENPVGIMSGELGPPTQYIQPYEYGHPESKKTGLWLRNLPALRPTHLVVNKGSRIHSLSESPERSRLRSRTYEGVAAAMASQWGIEGA